MGKNIVRLPLTNGNIIGVKLSTIQLVHQDAPIDKETECYVSTTNKVKHLHRVAMAIDEVLELIG